jgi:hypothetical protein
MKKILVVTCLILWTFTSVAESQNCMPVIKVKFSKENSKDRVDVFLDKDISNLVYEDCSGKHVKLDDLTGQTFFHVAAEIKSVWVKSGCNFSNDGPGYGEKFSNSDACQPTPPPTPEPTPEPPQCPTENECEENCNEFFPNDPHRVPNCVQLCVNNCGNFCENDECANEKLKPKACSEANGFLGQINIASIINVSPFKLNFEYSYTDLTGEVKSKFLVPVEANTKFDVIVNDHGLEKDSYGTVCIESPIKSDGLWFGGVSQYKPVAGTSWSNFEFVLYYAFENKKTGLQVSPLNSYTLGGSKVANWIRITDAKIDGEPLYGTLFIYEGNVEGGDLKFAYNVNIPDGGRFDYDAHSHLPDNTIGSAVFVPHVIDDVNPEFYFTSARYAYNCDSSLHSPFACNDFLTAFTTTTKKPINGSVYNSVSTVDNRFSVVEINNPVEKETTVLLSLFDEFGTVLESQPKTINAYGSYHYVVNGVLGNNKLGFVRIDNSNQFTTSNAVSYLFSPTAVEYGTSNRFSRVIKEGVQISEFNSFLDQTNHLELINTSSEDRVVKVDLVDYTATLLGEVEFTLEANKHIRVKLELPGDTYGTITVHGDDVLVRNNVQKESEYLLIFSGK